MERDASAHVGRGGGGVGIRAGALPGRERAAGEVGGGGRRRPRQGARGGARRRARGGGGGGHAAEAATAAADAAAERAAAEAAAENREAAHEKAVRQLITEATERIEDEKTALRRQLREQEAANEVRAAAAADHHRLLLQGVRRDAEEAVKARDAHHAEEASRLRAEAAEALEAQHHAHTTRLLEVQAEAEEKVASAHDGSRLKEAYEEARELERGARLAAREIALLRDELRHVEAEAEAQRAAAARAGDELERLRESAEVAGVTRREERARVEERRSAALRKELERTRLLLGLAQKDAAVARRGGASAATPKEIAARTCSSSTATTGAAASARPAVAFGRAVPAPAPAPVAAAPATRPTPATRKTPQKPSWSTRPPLSWQLPGEMGAPPPPTFSLADVLADECFDAASPYRPAIPRAAAEEGTGGSYLDHYSSDLTSHLAVASQSPSTETPSLSAGRNFSSLPARSTMTSDGTPARRLAMPNSPRSRPLHTPCCSLSRLTSGSPKRSASHEPCDASKWRSAASAVSSLGTKTT